MCVASQQSEVLLHTPAMRSDLQAVHYHRILRLKGVRKTLISQT